MAYKPNARGLIRDKAYPSEIAAQRPALATRLHCEIDYTEEREMEKSSIRGDRGVDLYPSHEPSQGRHQGDITEDRVAEFNRALRAGHGFRNEGDE